MSKVFKYFVNLIISDFYHLVRGFFSSNNLYSKSDALYDLENLLSFVENCNLSEYMYYKSPKLYDNLVKYNKNYYLLNDEVSVIKHNLHIIATFLNQTRSIVEIGPGSNSTMLLKTSPIVAVAQDLCNYTAVDISKRNANDAIKIIKKNANHISVNAINYRLQDLKLEHFDYLGNYPKCFMFLGSTIGNYSSEEAKSLIANISDLMQKNDKLIITFDSNKDFQMIKKAYDNYYAHSLVMNTIISICDILELNDINLEAFKTKFSWDAKSCSVKYSLVSNINQDLYCTNTRLIIKKDTNYFIVSSKKYDQSDVLQLLPADLIITNCLKSNTGYMNTYLIKKV